MCRLFGLSAGSEPVTARFWLLDAPDSLRAQSHREPDGTGLGYFDADGLPHIDKKPLAAFADRAFAREARTVRSPTFVGHVRFASTGGVEPKNTHPFEQRGRVFAHNGVLQDLPKLEQKLGNAMQLVSGDTDSERMFALITTEIERQGDTEKGITAAVTWIAENLPVLSLNFVLIMPEELWALRYPAVHELHVLERAASGPLRQHSSHGTRIESEHAAQRRTVVVASETMDDDPGWRAIEPGELIHVTPALEARSEVIIDKPPVHELTLEELTGHARSSQA